MVEDRFEEEMQELKKLKLSADDTLVLGMLLNAYQYMSASGFPLEFEWKELKEHYLKERKLKGGE